MGVDRAGCQPIVIAFAAVYAFMIAGGFARGMSEIYAVNVVQYVLFSVGYGFDVP